MFSDIGRLFEEEVELEGSKDRHHSVLDVVIDFLYFQLALCASLFGGSQCFGLHCLNLYFPFPFTLGKARNSRKDDDYIRIMKTLGQTIII